MKESQIILSVDSNRRNQELLQAFLAKHGYRSMPVFSLTDLDQALVNPAAIGLAMVDIGGFDRTIWERCEQLRNRGVPFLVLSPRQSAAIQQASLSHGARGVYIKPLAVKELLVVIRTLMGEE